MRTRWRSLPEALALGVALVGLSVLASPQVYGESLMVKVRPDTPPRAAAPVELLGARNEALGFQVVVHGGDSGATGVTARLDALEGPARIGSSHLTLYRQDFLVVTHPSGGPGGPGPWPDALTPAVDEVAGEPRNAFPFDVPSNEARALWVDVLIPEDAPAGRYQGVVDLRAGGGFTASVPVTLTVVDVTLPSTPSYPTSFGLEADRVCEAHTGRADCGSDSARAWSCSTGTPGWRSTTASRSPTSSPSSRTRPGGSASTRRMRRCWMAPPPPGCAGRG
ncbi:glycoside hydrolase domain-containing protein [Pyxidicoccus trucidator]|uniref:glycoside hydrolase domain-containing protein n=1 Tax=Pyxidicoccus trucidator TaxID=2709662 RepID=UPI001F0725B4|nr:glycoside hydrolase domain-containing protein [Pyxidicoccus trucidator]